MARIAARCTSEQQSIIDAFMLNPAPLTFIQGKAGTGKSFLIRELASRVPGTLILTPTNMAKGMYANASTMHSFFYGEFDDLEEGYQNPRNYNTFKNRLDGFPCNVEYISRLKSAKEIIAKSMKVDEKNILFTTLNAISNVEETIFASRGSIYDANGIVVAQDVQTYDIICYLEFHTEQKLYISICQQHSGCHDKGGLLLCSIYTGIYYTRQLSCRNLVMEQFSCNCTEHGGKLHS